MAMGLSREENDYRDFDRDLESSPSGDEVSIGKQDPEHGASRTPPVVNDENQAARELQMSRQMLPPGNELLKGDLQSSIIPETAPAKATPEPEEPSSPEAIAAQHSEQRQRLNRSRLLQQVSADPGTNKVSGQVMPGVLSYMIRKIPGVSGMMARFQNADLDGKINVLSKLVKLLKLAKTTAAISDAVIFLVETTTALFIETIGLILLVTIPIAPIMIIYYAIAQEHAPSRKAKVIAKAIKSINKTLVALEKARAEEENKKAALEELEDASESMNPAQQQAT